MNKQLFMGNGQASAAQCFHLVEQLMAAFYLLSGIQQPLDPCEKISTKELEIDKQRRFDDEDEIELIVREIAKSLTGKKITFGD